MSKKKNDKSPIKTSVIYESQTQGNYGKYSMDVNHFIKESPYFLSCTDAFNKSDAIKITPYTAAYDAAKGMPPSIYSDDVGFNDIIYDQMQESETIPAQELKETEAPIAPVKKQIETRFFKKRGIPLLLILVFSLVALALPLLSSLEVVTDYVAIGEDVLTITDIFEGDLGLETLTDNLPIILVAVYLVFALILTLKSLFAIVGKKKKKFGFISLITLLLAAAFLVASFEFDFALILDSIADINYGILAMIACPLFVLLLDGLAYKKVQK